MNATKLFLAYSRENGVILSVLEIVQRISAKSRGRLYRKMFTSAVGAIGSGAYIRGLSHIRIDRGFSSGAGLWLEALVNYRGQTYSPTITIAEGVALSKEVHISAIHQIHIGAGVLVGSHVFIGDHNHGNYRGAGASSPEQPPAERRLAAAGPLRIESNVWIGDGVVILGAVSIGRGAIVAANSVVITDVPPATIVAGNPARAIRRFNSETAEWERWI